jgi:alpha-tubulin suppressor-like RCC1 family protein
MTLRAEEALARLRKGNHHFVSDEAGGALTCGMTVDGVQYCWGLNQDGQLGDGTRESRSSPVRVAG